MDAPKFTKEIYDQLLAAVEALPKEAIENTKKEITRKGYDTTGYQYQYLVNVLNEVLTPAGWLFEYSIVKDNEGKWQNGRTFYDLTVNITMNILGAVRACAGGHRSEMYSDALKGAITNAFKKTVALYGVGKKAYEGSLDEDYQAIHNDVMDVVAPLTRPQPQHTTFPYPNTVATSKNDTHCSDCGAKKVRNPKTGKMFCKAKCWLQKGGTALQQSFTPPATISYDEPPMMDQPF